MLGVIEGPRYRADDLEAERLPQVYGGGVGLDDRVELDARKARRAAPAQDVLPEGAAYTLTLARRIDKERRRRHVRSAARAVGSHLRRAHDDALADGYHRLAGRSLHPPGPGLLEGL